MYSETVVEGKYRVRIECNRCHDSDWAVDAERERTQWLLYHLGWTVDTRTGKHYCETCSKERLARKGRRR